MNIKKRLVSAAAALGIMASGAFPAAGSVQALGEKNWLNLSLKASAYSVAPGQKVEVTVSARGFAGDSNIGGYQLKLKDGYTSSSVSRDGLKLVEIKPSKSFASNLASYGNTDYGEFVMWPSEKGTTLKESQDIDLATFVYEVPKNAAITSYTFNVDQMFTYFCDPDGEDIPFEANYSYAGINISNGGNSSGSFYFEAQQPSNISPDSVFTVNVLYRGDTTNLSGFQWQFDIPEEFICLGLASPTNSMGMDITFNPKTYEIASATKDGLPVQFKDGDVVASVNFKASGSYVPSGNKVDVDPDSVEASDTNGNTVYPSNASPKGLLGDANLDGKVNSSDASAVLGEYALLSTGQPAEFTAQMKKNGDVNFDNKIDSKDASDILAFYSYLSTGGSGTMENWIANVRNK